MEFGELRVGGVKGVGVGVADAGDDVPVVAGRARERERAARSNDVQATVRVEGLSKAE